MASVEELLAEGLKKNVGECKNGMSLEGLAQSAFNVMNLCLDRSMEHLSSSESKDLWVLATTELARHIEEELAKENGMVSYAKRAKVFYDTVSDPKILEFENSPIGSLIAECVVRHICNCVNSEPGQVNVPQLEKSMPLLFKKLQEKQNPPARKDRKAQNGTYKEPAPAFVTTGPANPNWIQHPEAKKGQVGDGVASGFREVIQLKIAEYNRKIVLLRDLDQKIGPECDEALWEVFKDVFTKEK